MEPLSAYVGVPLSWADIHEPGYSGEDARVEAAAPDGAVVARLEPDGPTAVGFTAAGDWCLWLGRPDFSVHVGFRDPPAARIQSGRPPGQRIELALGRQLPVRGGRTGTVVVEGHSGAVLTLEPSGTDPFACTVVLGPEPLDEPALSQVMLLGYYLTAPGPAAERA